MYKHFLKRLFDFLLALVALIILSPIVIPVIIGLLLTGEHYVFYFQKRIGYKNKPFNIWKFATMLKQVLIWQEDYNKKRSAGFANGWFLTKNQDQ